MKKLFLIVVALALLIGLGACSSSTNKKAEKAQAEKQHEYMVVAYVAGYRDFDFSTIDVSGITHINYAFGNIRDGEAVFDTAQIDGKYLTPEDVKKLNNLKSRNPDLKVLISVGGWTWSGGFSDAALTPESRDKFAKSCTRMVKDFDLDGIDLDWEYPNQVGAGNVHRPEDVHNFTLMLKAVREELDKLAEEEGNGGHYLLAIATGADKHYVDNVEMAEIAKYLDFLNIMTYDFYNGLHNVNGHHANLMPSARPELDMNSVMQAVDWHTEAGFPADRINLGIPFYGRIWNGVDIQGDDILFNSAETVGMGIDYIDFCDNVNANGFTRYWDDVAKAPYLWNPEEKTFISYEDEESIALKIEYLKKRGLAGVMFWEYSADKDSRLLNAITENL